MNESASVQHPQHSHQQQNVISVETNGHIPNSVQNVEFLNLFRYGGHNMLINFMSLFSFVGARHVISDLYDNRRDLLCNPIIKIIILFSIIFVNIKNVKISILIFFIYLCFIDNYLQSVCSPEYIQNINSKNTIHQIPTQVEQQEVKKQ
jgi:hypothetical protein